MQQEQTFKLTALGSRDYAVLVTYTPKVVIAFGDGLVVYTDDLTDGSIHYNGKLFGWGRDSVFRRDGVTVSFPEVITQAVTQGLVTCRPYSEWVDPGPCKGGEVDYLDDGVGMLPSRSSIRRAIPYFRPRTP